MNENAAYSCIWVPFSTLQLANQRGKVGVEKGDQTEEVGGGGGVTYLWKNLFDTNYNPTYVALYIVVLFSSPSTLQTIGLICDHNIIILDFDGSNYPPTGLYL